MQAVDGASALQAPPQTQGYQTGHRTGGAIVALPRLLEGKLTKIADLEGHRLRQNGEENDKPAPHPARPLYAIKSGGRAA